MFPTHRLRRLRRSESMRRLVRESRITVDDLVCPIFVDEGLDARKQVAQIPGMERIPLNELSQEIGEIQDVGISAVMLFGIPRTKDDIGSSAYDDHGIVQKAIAEIKNVSDDIVIMADVCVCQYASSGHCGIYRDGVVDNDATLPYLSKIAISYAKSGVDVVAPSAMMDGQVSAVRSGLDDSGFENVAIMPQSAKHGSALYASFRSACSSAPQFGDRQTYQVPYTNARETMAELQSDIEEGADIVMIKPALMHLDLIAEARRRFDVPIATHSSAGEYTLVQAAHQMGWLDRHQVALEMLGSMKRAGADIIITYFSKYIAKILK